MSRPLYKYLKPEDIRKLSSFEFAPKLLVEGFFAGRHCSRMQGLSTEFRDYRQYVSGDDISFLDWGVFARTDRYYVKTYEQETNTVCHIFLDSSASMGFGTKATKLEYGSFFAAALCYLVTRGGNTVSLQIFDDRIRNFNPPGSTPSHLHNLLHVLEKNRPGNATNLGEALRRSFPLLHRRGSLVIISDFFDDPVEIFSALNQYVHRGFKIYLFHILAPEELDLGTRGLLKFVDMENDSALTVHTDSIRPHYERAIAGHIGAMRALSCRKKVEYTFATTETHYFSLFEKLVK